MTNQQSQINPLPFCRPLTRSDTTVCTVTSFCTVLYQTIPLLAIDKFGRIATLALCISCACLNLQLPQPSIQSATHVGRSESSGSFLPPLSSPTALPPACIFPSAHVGDLPTQLAQSEERYKIQLSSRCGTPQRAPKRCLPHDHVRPLSPSLPSSMSSRWSNRHPTSNGWSGSTAT